MIKKRLSVNHPHIWGSCDYCGMDFWGRNKRHDSRHFLLANDAVTLYIDHLVRQGDLPCKSFVRMNILDSLNMAKEIV